MEKLWGLLESSSSTMICGDLFRFLISRSGLLSWIESVPSSSLGIILLLSLVKFAALRIERDISLIRSEV